MDVAQAKNSKKVFDMTKKQAALKTYIMWSWIAQNRGSKTQYPLYKELGYEDLVSACPWCELFHKNTQGRDICSSNQCPLVHIGQNCDTHLSWYKRTRFFNSRTKIAAGNITALAWKEYKRLGG